MSNLGSNFYNKLVQLSSRVGIRPEDLLVVMVGESGLNPNISNSIGATGLIQFMPSTLKGLGYKGNYKQFSKLDGESQLDYVEKYINSLGQSGFKSASHYYVGNLFPLALRLPGIKNQDPNTIILEKNPPTVPNPQNPSQLLSKKYADIGAKVTADFEHAAFTQNPGFHHGKDTITYGDLQQWVESRRNNPIYKNAVKEMQEQTGHAAQPTTSVPVRQEEKQPLSSNRDELDEYLSQYKTTTDQIPESSKDMELDNYLQQYKNISQEPGTDSDSILENVINKYLQASHKRKMLQKQSLKLNNIVIKVGSNDYTIAAEYARLLSLSLDKNYNMESSVHSNNNEIEVSCKVFGNTNDCFQEVILIADALKKELSEIITSDINAVCIMNKTSSYKQMTWKSQDNCYQQFCLNLRNKTWQ